MPWLESCGERVPELAARDRIDAGGGLVQQQDARLGHQRAGQRELLLHAAAQPAGQPVGEALHPEHRQVAPAALLDLGARTRGAARRRSGGSRPRSGPGRG